MRTSWYLHGAAGELSGPAAKSAQRAARPTKPDAASIVLAARGARAAALRGWSARAWSAARRTSALFTAALIGQIQPRVLRWRDRRDMRRLARELQQLDARMLRDIGVENFDAFLSSSEQARLTWQR